MKASEYKNLYSDTKFRTWFKKVPWCLTGAIQNSYDLERALVQEFERLSILQSGPRFSLLTPLYNTPVSYLQELIWSLKAQSWQKWQLILVDNGSIQREHCHVAHEAANSDSRILFVENPSNLGISGGRNRAFEFVTGDYVAILDHDDLLHPQALGIYARVLLDKPDLTLLYSNELKLSQSSSQISDFIIKPDFDWSTLLRVNYICHLAAVKTSTCHEILKTDSSLFKPQYDGCEDHHWFLQLSKLPEFKAHHLPIFSYYWRKSPTSTANSLDQKPYASEHALKMLRTHLIALEEQRGVKLNEIRIPSSETSHQCFTISLQPVQKTSLSILVPFRDAPEMTEKALNSIAKQSMNHLDVKIVAIDNRSNEVTRHRLRAFQESWKSEASLEIRSFDEAFNYNRMHNKILSKIIPSDFILFMNNDVELKDPHTLSRMAGEMRLNPKLGACGLRLMYPDEQEIQHGGIKLLMPSLGLGYYSTAHVGSRTEEYGFDEHCASAVTFACAMVRWDAYKKLNGLDEVYCPNGYGDTDFCLRLREHGYDIFYLGTVWAVHHESKTRPAVNEDAEIFFLNHHRKNLQDTYLKRIHYEATPWGWLEGSGTGILDMPLRYRLADQINEAAKKYLRPVHRFFKRKLRRN